MVVLFVFGFIGLLVLMAFIIIHYDETHFQLKNNSSVGFLVEMDKIYNEKLYFPNKKYKKKSNEQLIEYTLFPFECIRDIYVFTSDNKNLLFTVKITYQYYIGQLINLAKNFGIYPNDHKNYIFEKFADIIRDTALKYSKADFFNSNTCSKIGEESLQELRKELDNEGFKICITSLKIRPTYYYE